MTDPKIGVMDIEISPTSGTFWGSKYETNILDVTHPWVILSFSWKWISGPQKGTHITRGLPDYKGYKRGSLDDSRIVKDLHGFLETCDILVAQNGDSFDVRKMNARFIVHRLNPPHPYRTVDTLKIARRKFGFTSNKLDDLGATLGIGRKIDHEGYAMWKKCMAGDPKAWRQMLKYNKQDVLLLEAVYLRLLPWASNHPNIGSYHETDCCSKCGSTNTMFRGFNITQAGRRYQRIQCKDCGGWSQDFSNRAKHRPLKAL